MLPVAILAGGLGSRLQPVTQDIPKSLIDIHGVPFIDYQLRLLADNGIQDVVLCLGYKGKLIQDFVGDGRQYGLVVHYSFDGNQPLGTGGALANALPLLGWHFFVLYGDAYPLCNFTKVFDTFIHIDKLAVMTISGGYRGRHRRNVQVIDHMIVRYDKTNATPQMEFFDYGVEVFSRRAFINYNLSQSFDLEFLFSELVEQKQLASLEIDDPIYEIGSIRGIDEFKIYCQGLG